PRDHLETVRFDLLNDLTKVRDRESDVIDSRPSCASCWSLLPEEDEHVRELHYVCVVRTELDGRPTQRVDEELLLCIDIRRFQMMVTVDDWSVLGDIQLG